MLTEMIRILAMIEEEKFPRVEFSLRPDVYDALVAECWPQGTF